MGENSAGELFKVVGLPQVFARLDAWVAGVTADAEKAAMKVGYKVSNYAKKATPVETGLLRSSWQVKKLGTDSHEIHVRVFNDVFYAADVEFGTEFMEPRAMLRRALQQLRGEGVHGIAIEMKSTDDGGETATEDV